MHNYLIADYILGYSLSSDSFFSAQDIAKELSMPSGPISKILTELCELKAHWFEIMNDSPEGEIKIVRRKEFDDEIIQWLIDAESKNYYKEAEMLDSPYEILRQSPPKNEKVSLKSVLKVIAVMSAREVKKERKWVLKYLVSIKNSFRRRKSTR